MVERIDIVVPDEELKRNAEKEERLRRTRSFEATDRVPVAVGVSQWTGLAARGRIAADYVRTPKDNLREQILNRKWRIENVRDDLPIPTGALSFQPDLGCLRAVEFDMEIIWPEDGPPKCTHPLVDPRQIDSLRVPDPAGGLNARRIDWYHAMRDAARDLDVRLNGEPLEIQVTLTHPGGPIPAAFALAGANLFLWMAAEPERAHRLMDIVTESHMRGVRFFDEMMDRDPSHPVGLGCDAGEMVGPDMYMEFVAPYYLRIWEAYGGPRSFHNCGKNDHLLDIIGDDLQIDRYNGFGACTDPAALAEKMAGRILLQGGPDPVLVLSGSREEIVRESRRYIETLGRRGGYIMDCGCGTAPGTPPEHFSAMVEASIQAGCVMDG